MIDRAVVAPGVVTAAGFVGGDDARVFVTRTGPDTTPNSRVFLCPPIGGEGARNYRREVLLARRLAEQGVETVRFHYRGTGQSGPAESGGFLDMVSDADLVQQSVDSEVPTTWMGTRIGGLVAAAMVRDSKASLAIWDPVLDPVAYMREILRARVFSAFKRDEAGTAPKADLIKELQTAGSIDLLGYRIESSLLDELTSTKRLADLDVTGRSVLLVDLRRKGDPRAEVVRLGAEWEARGARVSVVGVALYEPWWYGARSGAIGDERSEANLVLLDVTVRHLTDRWGTPT